MKKASKAPVLYERVREILAAAQAGVARTVNTTQVVANWLIGREIVEEEQHGQRRAEYGARIIENLARQITRDFGAGYSAQNLFYMKQFFLGFPALLPQPKILHAVRGESPEASNLHAVRGELEKPEENLNAMRVERAISHARRDETWQAGRLHPNLSWTHYRTLLRVEKTEARSFYEIEAIQNNWSARELERQINSLLYERLSLSRDKNGLLRLARKGQEIQGPLDVFKDPLVLEFLKIPAAAKLVESDLETALLGELQTFLLELGRGFAFVARQERITLDGDHFYIDLVFYHTVLKCYIVVDLKVGKLTHQDLGQLELYVNYYDRERLTQGDNPTLGLILCTDKNDTVVRYTLGEAQRKKIFASRYKLHLPSETELKTELLREVKNLRPATSAQPVEPKKKTKP